MDPSSQAAPSDRGVGEHAPADARRRIGVALAAVTAAAFALRFAALDRLLPVHPEPDASMVWVLRSMAGETVENLGLHQDVYPSLLPRLASLSLLWAPLEPAPPDASLAEHLAAASAPFVKLRALGAALAALAAPLTFALARSFLGARAALLAALLLATSLLHVAQSSVAKPHAAAATFIALTLVLALRQLRTPTLGAVALTTLGALLATSTLQTGLFVLPAMAVSALLLRDVPRRVRLAALAAPVIVATVGPGSLLSRLSFDSEGVTMGTGHVIEFAALNGEGLVAWLRMLWENDPALSLLAFLGGLFALAATARGWRDPARRGAALVVLSFAAPYLLLLALDQRVNDRYLLPLYPVAAVLAAAGVAGVAAKLTSGAGRAAWSTVATVACALPAVCFTWIGCRADTFEQLASWLQAQPADTERRLNLTPSVVPPLFPTQKSVRRQSETSSGASQPWIRYLSRLERTTEFDAAWEMRALPLNLFGRAVSAEDIVEHFTLRPPGFIVIENSARTSVWPGAEQFLATVRANSDRLATFSAEDGRYSGALPIDYQGAPDLALRAVCANCLGPDLEVYRWRSSSER